MREYYLWKFQQIIHWHKQTDTHSASLTQNNGEQVVLNLKTYNRQNDKAISLTIRNHRRG